MQEHQSMLKIGLVYGHLPSLEELDQFNLIANEVEISVICAVSVADYLQKTEMFSGIKIIPLPDYDENPSYLPGLENVLGGFDIVLIKERLGLYAYQALKVRMKHKYKLAVWIDNITPFVAEDVTQMRTIRNEVTDNADLILVQSKAARDALLVEGVDPLRIQYLEPWARDLGVRTVQNRAKVRESLGFSEEDFVIGFAGPLEWEERVWQLAHAASLAISEDASLKRRLKLVLAGVGSFAGHIRDRFINLGIDDRTVFLSLGKETYESVIAASDCLFFAPIEGRDRLEGDPYRVIPAMANGLPILACRNSIVEEYVGKHRLDFCGDSVASLAAAIEKAVTSKALLKDIVKKTGQEIRTRFNGDKIRQKMLDLFGQLALTTVRIDSSSIDFIIYDIEAKVRAKQYLSAIEAIESVMSQKTLSNEQHSSLYRLIGDCFTKLGDLDSGKDAYTKAIDFDKMSSKAHIGLGTVCLAKSGFDLAVVHFQKAIQLAPNDEMASFGLGLSFQGMGEFREASGWIKRSLEINPTNTAAIYSYLTVSHEIKSYEGILEALKTYLTIHPQDDNMLFTVAGLYFRTGEFKLADEYVQKILSMDATDQRAQGLAKQIQRSVHVEQQKALNVNG